MLRLYLGLVICLLLMASCTVVKYYELRWPEFPVIPSKDKWITYRSSIDGIDVDIRAVDKNYCHIIVGIYIKNNRLDTLYADMSLAELWYTGGHFSPIVQNRGGKKIRENVTMIQPGKQASITMDDFVCSFSEGNWVQVVYAFPGTIYTSSGFEVTLDTLEFVLPQDR